ncbi:hypothetical protein I302_103770 [Kwoniella bestiolae CBS 10118]|uniref:tRNA-splicing endonuclease subunit Sen54 N-terminal domain-containing protein n=1 Tax=Kwoniella bestiolae CBS 10118 TaxID=1296100 RepID=A0A1B9G9I2_9TREE|nr:hypothetical protein I302_02474 [Kwoniella bestiolae CBS 10118]OCF27630.1 hypothetical protein I302_02474 [Kwoniella bestiolae CBS 10118]
MSVPQPSAEAGPSRSKLSTPRKAAHASGNAPSSPAQNDEGEGDNPRTDLSAVAATPRGTGGDNEGEEEGDEERMDIKLIQSFADKIQHLPSSSDADGITSRSKIIIPRRGEKDFEPLSETVNLQEMMLQKSREALFNALVGVRGGNSKSISHAIITPSNPYPKMLIIHGHLFDTIGMSIRYPTSEKDLQKGKSKGYSQTELLPEEALYLLERGTLQIWMSNDLTEEEKDKGYGEWSDEEYGVKGAVEMSVMDGFGTFIGRDGLSWERYQAYAYMKRLGYTVQRTRHFIPDHFLFDPLPSPPKEPARDPDALYPGMQPFHTWWLNLPKWIAGLFRYVGRNVRNVVGRISRVGLSSDKRFKGTLLEGWTGDSYKSIFQHLRLIPQGHSQPLPIRPSPAPESLRTKYDILLHNPYLPFYHIWKPSAPFTKRGWDKGSESGLRDYPPTYWAGVVESRSTPIPTIQQLDEIFNIVPDEPKGPVKKVGPQYVRPPRPPRPANPNNKNNQTKPPTYLQAILQRLGVSTKEDKPSTPFVNIPAIRNGDRAFIVAVNDSGNTGWVRFGRSGFAEFAPV